MSNRSGGERSGLRVCLHGGSLEARRQIRTVLEGLGDPPVEVAEEGGAANWDVAAPRNGRGADIVIAVSDGEAGWLERLTGLAATAPHPPVIAVTPDRAPAAIRRILQAGAGELLFFPIDPNEARRVMLKLTAAQEHAARRGGGRVVSVASLTGGAGVTTLAGNLAVGLRRFLGKQVALVDLDLQAGALTGFFNVSPERTLADLAGRERQLDSIQLEAALCKHSSGVYLLAAPEQIEDCEAITDQTVSAVLDLMRELFDFVLVDCGGRIDENAVAAWERSSHVLYMVEHSIAATRAALRFTNLFGRLGLHNVEPAYLLGRYQPRHAITEGQLADTLGKAMFARIPRDGKLFERAALRGEDLWTAGRGRPAARAVEELCRRLANGAVASEAHRQGLRGRLHAWMERRGSAPSDADAVGRVAPE